MVKMVLFNAKSIFLPVCFSLVCSTTTQAQGRFDPKLANHCIQFENFAERNEWWLREYGPTVTLVMLLYTEETDLVLRYGQLQLVVEHLQEQGKLDYQKLMLIQAESHWVLGNLFDEEKSLLLDLHERAISVIRVESVESRAAKICAFECRSEIGAPSRDFLECIEKEQ